MTTPATLPRKLGLADLLALSIGNMIGAAIFLIPGIVAGHLQSPELMLGAWVFAGLCALAGALTCAELGVMYPTSGGQYVYLKESLGPFWGFLFGWTTFIAIRTGGIASLSVAFAIYLGHFIPLNSWQAKLVSVSLILGLAAINQAGVRLGANTQIALTFLKLGGLFTIILFGFLATPAPSVNPPLNITIQGVGAALLPCMFAYQGWFSIPMVAGEVKNPSRILPLSLGLGVLVVMAVYLAANVSYIRVLGMADLAKTSRVAAEAMQRVIGSAGAGVVSLAILFSIAGAMNAGTLAGPRIYFAQARDGLFFPLFARIHTENETPAAAIWLQAGASAAFALTGSYERLVAYASFTSWLFYTLTVIGLFRLRRLKPGPRKYSVPGYPFLPALFAVVSTAFLISAIAAQPLTSLGGVALIAAGTPLYWYWTRYAVKHA